MKIDVGSFSGMVPELSDRKLPNTASAVARNTELWSGDINNINETREITTLTKTGSIRSLFKISASVFMHWPEIVDVAHAPFDTTDAGRVYYTGHYGPKVTNTALATQSGTNYPSAYYRLGLPGPDTAPTVGHTGGSGSSETRSYVYTFVSPWGEEGPPSSAGTHTGVDDATQWDISAMDVAPPNSFTIDTVSISAGVCTMTASESHFLDARTSTNKSTGEYITFTETSQIEVDGAKFNGRVALHSLGITGVANGATGTLAFAFNLPTGALATGPMRVFTIPGSTSSHRFEIEISTDGILSILARDSAGATKLDLQTATGVITEGVTYRVLADWDTAAGADLYINDVDVADTATVTAGDINYVGAGAGAGGVFLGGIGEDVESFNLPAVAHLVSAFTYTASDSTGRGVFWKPDGLKLYIVGDTNNKVYQYPVSTAWDTSTVGAEEEEFSVASEDTTPTGLFFKPDGTKLYVVGTQNDSVYEYALSVAWDISSAGAVQDTHSVAGDDTNPQGIFFKSDGTKLYVMGNANQTIFQYPLSTAWDLSTAGASDASKDVSLSLTTDLQFSPDGVKCYVLGSALDSIYQFRLSTPWDISTLNTTSEKTFRVRESTSTGGFAFSADGATLYVVESLFAQVMEFSLTLDKPFTGSLRGFYLHCGTRIGISTGSNRLKFFDADDQWEDLGVDGSTPTGTVPELLFANTYDTFHENLGDGGDLTVVQFSLEPEIFTSPGVFDGVTVEAKRTSATQFTFNTTVTEANPFSTITVAREAPIQTTGMTKRLYRQDTAGDYRLVETDIPIATTTATDTLTNALHASAALLESTTWIAPPSSLHSIINMPGGFMAGLCGKQVLFSEPGVPYSWPEAYTVDLELTGIGLSVRGNTLIVMTDGEPYSLTGLHPLNMSERRHDDFPYGCLSKSSIVQMPGGVMYSTDVGLAYGGPGGFQIVTENVMERDEWQVYKPSTIIGARYADRYMGFFSTAGDQENASSCFVFDPMQPNALFVELSEIATATYFDHATGDLYLVGNDNVVGQFDAGVSARPFFFRSKRFLFGTPWTPRWARVRVQFSGGVSAAQLATDIAAALAALDAARAAKTLTDYGAVGSHAVGSYCVSGGPYLFGTRSAANTVNGLTFTLFANGEQKYSLEVSDNEAFRLVEGYEADDFYFEMAGADAQVIQVTIAEDGEELAVAGLA